MTWLRRGTNRRRRDPGDASSARAAIERLVSLQREHGLELAPEDQNHTPFPLDIEYRRLRRHGVSNPHHDQ